MILNRNEKEALWNLFQGGQANGEEMIDAVIAEVVRKLAAGVSVEPVAAMFAGEDSIKFNKRSRVTLDDKWHELFTLDQLNTAIAAARVQENERCAKLIEDEEEDGLPLETLANGIRSSLGNSVSFETCYSPTPARREE